MRREREDGLPLEAADKFYITLLFLFSFTKSLYLSKCRLVSEALSGVVKTDRSRHRHPMRTRILGVRMRAAVSSSSFPSEQAKLASSTYMAPWAAFLCLLKAAAISVRTSPATPVMFLPKSLGKRKKIHR
jgi:hypothetical protein